MVVISNMIQGQIVNKRVRKENQAAQDEIRRYLGEEGFSDMVQKQEDHYKAYFKFEDEVAGEPVDSIDLEQEDEHKESESDIDDK